jgi:signal transduction histidine kinase
VTSVAYFAFLVARYGVDEVTEPAILLRMPFFLLAGAFYGFFVDRVRRGQIAAAAAQQREAARTEFLSLITHDLKQPLWIAQQSAGLLYDRLDRHDAAPRALAAQVMVSLRRMESLTLNFLDLGRIESSGIKIFPQRASLNEAVEDLIDSYGPALELKRLRLAKELDPRIGAARFDALQLQRALANLLDNAVKFTPEGGRVTVRTALGERRLQIVVGDSGPGIPRERWATLFTRFQHGRDSGGRRSTGLGLYIAATIVAEHGGTIVLDRQRRDGAWFTIELPLGEAEEPQRALEGSVPLAAAAAS